MSQRLTNLLASALVALVVSAAVSGAQGTPNPIAKPTHGIGTAALSDLPAGGGPSDHDRLLALIRRVNTLQNREAQDYASIKQSALALDDALAVTDCITSALYLVKDDATGAFVDGELSDPSGDYVPTLDESCIGGEIQ